MPPINAAAKHRLINRLKILNPLTGTRPAPPSTGLTGWHTKSTYGSSRLSNLPPFYGKNNRPPSAYYPIILHKAPEKLGSNPLLR